MSLSDSPSFQARCRGFQSRLPLHIELPQRYQDFHRLASDGLQRSATAQRQSHKRDGQGRGFSGLVSLHNIIGARASNDLTDVDGACYCVLYIGSRFTQ